MKHDPDTSCITIFSIALIAGYLNACSSPASSETLPVTPADISMLSKNENRNNSGLYTFQGICDGSAAVKIAADTILVAYDESTSLFAFKFTGGTATARRDLNDLLDLKSAAELDIEALAHHQLLRNDGADGKHGGVVHGSMIDGAMNGSCHIEELLLYRNHDLCLSLRDPDTGLIVLVAGSSQVHGLQLPTVGCALLLVVLLDARLNSAHQSMGGDPAAMAVPFDVWRAQSKTPRGAIAREWTSQLRVLLQPFAGFYSSLRRLCCHH